MSLLEKTVLVEEQKDFVNRIWRSAQMLKYIVNDLLDLWKIDAWKIELEMLEIDCKEMIQDVVNLRQQPAEEKGISLEMELQNDMPCFLGDPVRLTQILNNLISNAIKFTKEWRIIIEWECWLQKLKIRVIDTWCGMKKTAQKCIFDEYTQAEKSTTRKHGGTWLWLSICKKLVDIMWGKIKINSIFWEWTEFFISIPIKVVEWKRKEEKKEIKIDKKIWENKKILIVDDEDMNLVFMRKSFEGFGWKEIDLAIDGNIAVRKVKENDYDIIAMDIMMPNMSWTDALKEIRKMPGKKETKIVACTANVMWWTEEEYKRMWFDGYISKPVTTEELYVYMTRIINQESRAISIEDIKSFERLLLSKVRLLIADDDGVNRMVIKGKLKLHWVKEENIMIVKDGAEAVKAVKKVGDFDMILMDSDMPIMGWNEATKKIQEKIGKGGIPIIIFTWYEETDLKERELYQWYINKWTKELWEEVTNNIVKNIVSELIKHKRKLMAERNIIEMVCDKKDFNSLPKDIQNMWEKQIWLILKIYLDKLKKSIEIFTNWMTEIIDVEENKDEITKIVQDDGKNILDQLKKVWNLGWVDWSDTSVKNLVNEANKMKKDIECMINTLDK